MLFLIFELGRDRYAIDVRQIAEVLPLVAVNRLPGTPPGMNGVFNYRGAPVPLVDLAEVTLGRPSARRLSTRIVLVYYPDHAGRSRLLGLVAERATRTASYQPSDFVPSGISSAAAPYLSGIATDADGLLQRMDVATLLPPSVRDLLFRKSVDD